MRVPGSARFSYLNAISSPTPSMGPPLSSSYFVHLPGFLWEWVGSHRKAPTVGPGHRRCPCPHHNPADAEPDVADAEFTLLPLCHRVLKGSGAANTRVQLNVMWNPNSGEWRIQGSMHSI